MARKKSKQQGVGQKDALSGQQQTLSKSPVSPGDASGAGGGDAGVARTNQSMHTCCLLCHREFKDWGANSVNGLPASKVADGVPSSLLREDPGRKQDDTVPSLLGEVPLWICQSCKKSVEEDERRTGQEQSSPASLLHSSTCKSPTCGNGFPEQGSVDWDPSSFLSAHKLSGLWSSAHTNGGPHCAHAAMHSQGGPIGPSCHEKRLCHDAPGKAPKVTGPKICPYSHPASQNSNVMSSGSSLSTSADLHKTTPKHFKTMCRRPTPPGEAFHPSDHHHQHTDLSVPPNSPTGLTSHHSSLLSPKQTSAGSGGGGGQHIHAISSSTAPPPSHSPFSPLAPGSLLAPPAKYPPAGLEAPSAPHKPSGCKNPHIPAVNAQHGKMAAPMMGCSHQCNGHNGSMSTSNGGHGTPGTCRDQACKGHKVANGTLCRPPCELEEGEDEDSSSGRSSCASSSTNQKDGKYCDCCYCEFFGHNAPPAAPTSRNYAEIREKLRSRLTRRKEELPQRQDLDPNAVASAIDHRDVDELLDFINSTEPKPVNSAKAAKRARHKQKKKEKERAQQGMKEGLSVNLHPSPPELADDDCGPEGETSHLLEWPQLELERVNSFLTSRLEEIKNTIKDSIRASFSMYDLNLDVNDFPKKSSSLEGSHLLSHLNGSSDLQPIDLDMTPLSLQDLKRDLELVNGWEDAAAAAAASTAITTSTSISANTTDLTNMADARDTQRLNSAPSLSKLIRIRSPERGSAAGSEATQPSTAPPTKPKDEAPDAKNTTGASAKTKKVKKQQQKQQQQDPSQTFQQDLTSVKLTKMAQELQRVAPDGERPPRVAQQQQPTSRTNGSSAAENHRLGHGKRVAEDSKSTKHHQQNGSVSGTSNTGCGGWRESRSDQEPSAHSHSPQQQQQQQSKGKNKKNRNKPDKSNTAIDDVFLPKDVDPTEMDEIDREVEYFKRFCLDSAKQTRQKVAVNWSNFSLKKMPSNAAQ